MSAISFEQAVAGYVQVLKDLGGEYVDVDPSVWLLLKKRGRETSSALVKGKSAPAAAVFPARKSIPTPSPMPAVVEADPMLEAIEPGGGVEGKEKALKKVAAAVNASERCKQLFRRSKNMVFGVGTPDASIMFIGEAPGADEDEVGEPFVGKAGQLLTKMIQAMGLERQDVYIANIGKFRPDMPPGSMGNRKPTPEEMVACLPFVRAQVRIIQPKVIVALGATAVEGLLQVSKASITRIRGEWKEWEGIPLMPTYHPAYLLRNPSPSEKRKVWEDLMQAMERAGMTVSEKQRGYFLKAL